MIGKRALNCLFFILITNILSAQVQQEWIQRYNGAANSNDRGSCSTIDIEGNIIVCGTSSSIQDYGDYITIKYNSSGTLQWIRTYNGPGNLSDWVLSVKSDNIGNVYITGRSRGSGTGEDYCTIKYNTNGVEQWVQRYNAGGGDDIAERLVVDNFGNVYVTGESQTGLGNSADIATIKYDSSGVLQWVKRYSGIGGDSFGWDIALDQNNYIYVTGFTHDLFTGADIVTIKYDISGNQQWAKTYDGEQYNSEEARSIAIDNLNNVYVTGYTRATGTGPNYILIKYNSNGDLQWIRTYNGPGNYYDWALKVAVDNFSNVYITGFIAVLNPLSSDIATIKYNSNGVEQWVRTYSGPSIGNDNANSLTLDNLGNVYITGLSYDSTTLADFVTIKYNTDGTQQWIEKYNGPIDSIDQAFSVVVDGVNNVYVTGTSRGIGSLDDIVTIKYSQTIGIIPVSNVQPNSFELEQNFPNPFNPKTSINFQLPVKGYVKLLIFDILGRKIQTLVDEDLSAGVFSVEWNALNFPSGIYYYRLNTDQYIETKKMVLLK